MVETRSCAEAEETIRVPMHPAGCILQIQREKLGVVPFISLLCRLATFQFKEETCTPLTQRGAGFSLNSKNENSNEKEEI